ncbi:hypothetical protein BRARA_J00734 [Brassica rapa]|uniref:Uncharacterized protein n=1 Tax=Brassica campestris TaxID=3711 RepID=A0A397XRS5_BRACM|nr:hypothetical protein BRARA_J00734 [Brassica rapa]
MRAALQRVGGGLVPSKVVVETLIYAGRRWFGSRLVRFVVFLSRWLGCCLWRRAALPPSVWLGSEVCCCYVVARRML